MTEDGSEMASTNKNSNETRLFINRKLSLSKISEEESENPVEGQREDQKQLESIFEEGRDNNVCDKGENSEKTKLAYRTRYINCPEDNLLYKSSKHIACKTHNI